MSLTKNRGGTLINKRFELKPNYKWVDRNTKWVPGKGPNNSWSWLFSTAHQVRTEKKDMEDGKNVEEIIINDETKKPKFGPRHAASPTKSAPFLYHRHHWHPFFHRYTPADLDRLIGYKIYPDQRTRSVETHKKAAGKKVQPHQDLPSPSDQKSREEEAASPVRNIISSSSGD